MEFLSVIRGIYCVLVVIVWTPLKSDYILHQSGDQFQWVQGLWGTEPSSMCEHLLSVHTWDSPVSSLDPPVQRTAASLLCLPDGCSSDPALSDRSGWSSELRPGMYSPPQWPDSLTACKHNPPHPPHRIRTLNNLMSICKRKVQDNRLQMLQGARFWECWELFKGLSAQQNAESWPENFQSTVWTIKASREQLHSGILQVVVTQVQLSQAEGVGAENCWELLTTSLCETGLIQSSDKKT